MQESLDVCCSWVLLKTTNRTPSKSLHFSPFTEPNSSATSMNVHQKTLSVQEQFSSKSQSPHMFLHKLSTSLCTPYATARSVCKSYIRLEQMLGEQALSYPCIRKSSSNSSMSSEMPGFYLFENPCTLDHNTPRKYHSYKVFLSICAISSKELCSSF